MADADKPAGDVSCRPGPGSPWDGVTSYRTTDLELYSAEDLTALAAALEARGLGVLHRGRWIDATEWFRIAEPQYLWSFKAGGEQGYDDPEPEVAALLTAVEGLDPPARVAWDGCSQRVFDLGYDCGT